ncbi:hypothetical protein ACFQZV_02975 [Microbacterium koreense]|uniref:Uncharacterized protein n=1 Tax=Microbacterium koreense TaxID=323761 RepID=A0ABW2ZNR8_9MICO
MGISAASTTPATWDPAAVARLRAAGIDLDDPPRTGDASAGSGIADALALMDQLAVSAAVARRTDADRAAVERDLADAAVALQSSTATAALGMVVIPSTTDPRPGPVVVISPAESRSVYELYAAAAFAQPARRRVVHLNGRGSRASAVHSGIAARVTLRSASTEWREFPHAHPERALHTLTSRPAAIVAAVPPGSVEAARLIVDHPDADVILVFDRAHARFGKGVAEQIGSIVELAFGVNLDDDDGEPPADTVDTASVVEPTSGIEDVADSATDDLPPIRASDVVHVRLTSSTLELTNRTAQTLDVRVALGAASDPDVALAEFRATLAPGDTRIETTTDIPALRGIEPPHTVMRHWSHESEEVYEGGEQRIHAFQLEVRRTDGTVAAARRFRPGNGLDFFVTARELTAVIGRPLARSILPEPDPGSAATAPPRDIMAALAAALAVGEGVLTARSS